MQTSECRTAVDKLLLYLEDPGGHRADVDTAISHMKDCPHCQNRLGHLVQALSIEEEDRLTCRVCEELLPEYLQAEMVEEAGEARWRHVTLHLKTCPSCSEAYATLSDLMELGFGEEGEEPPYYPVPDLSFLPKKEPPPILWHLDELGRLIIEFSADLLRALQPPAYQPAYAPVRAKSDQSRKTLCQISLKEAVEDLEVTITAEEAREDTVYCTVMVEVDIPSRGGWPNLADTEVTIKRSESEPETYLTDAFGKAVFTGIATDELAHLIFEINPVERET
jgi:hypothetical protein